MSYKTVLKKSLVLASATAALLAAGPASAKCKYQVDMPSIVTGEQVRWTNWSTFKLVFSSEKFAVVNGMIEGDTRYVGLRVHVTNSMPERPSKEDLDTALIIPEGAKALFLMADDSVVELQSTEHFVGDSDFAVHGAHDYNLSSETIARYPVTADDLTALTAQRVKQIRLSTVDGDLDFEYGKKGSKKMQAVLECIK